MTLEIMQLGVAGAAMAVLTQFTIQLFRFLSRRQEVEAQRKAERDQLVSLISRQDMTTAALTEVVRECSGVIKENNTLIHRLLARLEVQGG